ncbi:hypothetical protein VTO42DRAFT_1396 [Malbranchea cinnamomea]
MPLFTGPGSKKLYYTDTHPTCGTPSHLTLLFIHGLGSSSSYYFPIIPRLSGLGYRCVTLDTHGNGSSPYTGQGNSIASIAADALSLLNTLQVSGDVVVVGHSMGGIVASHLAASDADGRLKGVVLIGPVHPNPSTAGVFEKRIQTVQEYGMEAMATTIPAGATGSNCAPLVRAFIRQLLIGQDPEGYVSLCRAIAEAPVPDYAKIKLPLLLLAGEEDKSAPLEGSKSIYNAYGTVPEKKDLQVLSGVGHWHVLEAPDEVGKRIARFLDSL